MFDLSYHLLLLGKPHLACGCHFFLLHHTQVALTHPCHFRMQTGSATPHHSVIKTVGYLMLGPRLTSPTRDELVSFLPLFPSWMSLPPFFNFYFRCMGVWLACLFVHYLHARCHWIPKGGVCSLELELPVGCESPCGCCGIEPGPSGRLASGS